MNEELRGIPDRILRLSLAALKRANTDAIFVDRGMEHRVLLAPLSAAHAGELLLKALIAKAHPLLIFRNLTESNKDQDIDLEWLLSKGQTHDFGKLPSLLRACTGIQIPDHKSFEELRKVRNQIQHFLPSTSALADISLEFIYKNIDPLLKEHFGLFAYQYHEDEFDDYVVAALLASELKFSTPSSPIFSEIDPLEELKNVSSEYRDWALTALGI